MTEKEPKEITASLIFSWIFGVIFFIWTANIFKHGNIMSGLVVLLCALLLIPPIKKVISEKLHVKFSGGITVIVILTGFTFLTIAFDSSPEEEAQTGEVVYEPEDLCPNMTTTTPYEFDWANNIDGNRKLWLNAEFLAYSEFSDSWVLSNFPDQSGYISDNFVCAPGAEAGQSTNKLYCDSTIYYKPQLVKNTVDADGNITKSQYTYIDSLIFDIAGKDIENNVDLASLVLGEMTCTQDSF